MNVLNTFNPNPNLNIFLGVISVLFKHHFRRGKKMKSEIIAA